MDLNPPRTIPRARRKDAWCADVGLQRRRRRPIAMEREERQRRDQRRDYRMIVIQITALLFSSNYAEIVCKVSCLGEWCEIGDVVPGSAVLGLLGLSM